MAFSKTPTQDTYSTVEFPFTKEMNSRGFSTDKDIDYLNIVFTHKVNKLTGEHTLSANKRCGWSRLSNSIVPSPRIVTGMHVWDGYFAGVKYLVLGLDNGDIKITSYNAGNFSTTATISAATSGLTTNTKIGFCDFLYDNGTVKLVATDGTKICTIDSGFTTVTSADADFPACYAQPIFMDGYVFLIKTLTGDIYNSDLNDPLAWTAGNFISTESSPDKVYYLHKIQNYLVAIGNQSVEFFYNAGVSTGSPLQVNRSLTQSIGLGYPAFPSYQYNDAIYFIGYNYSNNSASSALSLYSIGINGVKDIAPQNLKIFLNGFSTTPSNRNYYIGVYTYADIGADILVLTTSDAAGNYIYLALNLSNNTLTRFSQLPTNIPWSIRFIAPQTTPINIIYADSSGFYYIDDTANQDLASLTIPFHIITDLEDFDTINQKSMNRLTLVGEKPTSTANVNVQWTDDDYQNYNTAIAVNMNQELPSITRLGRFRRRALKISGDHSQPFSLDRIEVDINKGNT